MMQRLRRVCRASDYMVRWSGEKVLIMARGG